MKQFFRLLLIAITLASCTAVYFTEPMPRSGEIQTEFPDFLDGQFVNVDFHDKSMSCTFRSIDRVSNSHITIATYEVEYLDSASLVALEFSKIDTAFFQNQRLHVYENEKLHTFSLADSIMQRTEQPPVTINLEHGYLVDSDTNKCLLKHKGEKYYLNQLNPETQGFTSMEMHQHENELIICSSEWLLSDSVLRSLPFSHKFKRIGERDTLSMFSSDDRDYLADVSDTEFTLMMNRPNVFISMAWYKVNPPIPWIPIALAVLAIGIVGYIFKKRIVLA